MINGRSRKKGQISVLIVLSLLPLFTLVAFVVNVGMLVHTKISLQNAADLAAYAGAATQARQLTHVAHLNYQMRQSYKKFLFRYYVLGNMAMRCFPRGGAGTSCTALGGTVPRNTQPFNWINPGGGSPFPQVPAVCMTVSTTNNNCQIGESIPLVTVPSCNPLDPICGTIKTSIEQTQQIQQAGCKVLGAVNQLALALWLYSTSTDNEIGSQTNLNALVRDVGLVTENVMHLQRIRTIQTRYINAAPRRGIRRQQLATLVASPDQASVERTVLAYKSALLNLNERVFDPDDVELSELLPEADMLRLKDATRVSFDTFFLDNGEQDPCKRTLGKIPASVFVGVSKDPSSRVFYAVKLTAKARLLFNPFPIGNPDNSIDMTAYAAAAPFGSRIGPEIDPRDFTRQATINIGGTPTAVTIPFLALTNDKSVTMDSGKVLEDMYRTLTSDTQGSAGAISEASLNKATQAAQIPDDAEVGKYSIPVDPDSAFYQLYFHRDENNRRVLNQNGIYTFWAPLVSPLEGGDLTRVRETLKGELEGISLFRTSGTREAAILNLLLGKLDGFLNGLRGQNNFNVAQMRDPLGQAAFGGTIPSILGKVTDAKTLASSFSTDKDASFDARDGYSVKTVSFRSLFSTTGVGGNLGGLNGNAVPPSVNFGADRADITKLEY